MRFKLKSNQKVCEIHKANDGWLCRHADTAGNVSRCAALYHENCAILNYACIKGAYKDHIFVEVTDVDSNRP